MIGPIVGATWLEECLSERDVVVCEVRPGAGEHTSPHIPGARVVSVDADLAGPPGPTVGRHPLPPPEHFAGAMARHGIGDRTTVVAYDTGDGGLASRLVWMLRILGQRAALLDGGLERWRGPVRTDEPDVAPVHRTVRTWPAVAIADSDAVADHIADGGVVIDSRAEDRYLGIAEPIDPVAGHVPGAVNLPFAHNIEAGRFRSSGELGERFAAVRSDPDAIVYCGSGVTACHNALAMERAGLPRPRVYVASWSGWSTEPGRPVATGTEE